MLESPVRISNSAHSPEEIRDQTSTSHWAREEAPESLPFSSIKIRDSDDCQYLYFRHVYWNWWGEVHCRLVWSSLVNTPQKYKETPLWQIATEKQKIRQKLEGKWGHAIARGWATLLLDRLRDFVVVPSSAGGNSSFELHSQSMEERATLDRYHHFHGLSGMCAWLAS